MPAAGSGAARKDGCDNKAQFSRANLMNIIGILPRRSELRVIRTEANETRCVVGRIKDCRISQLVRQDICDLRRTKRRQTKLAHSSECSSVSSFAKLAQCGHTPIRQPQQGRTQFGIPAGAMRCGRPVHWQGHSEGIGRRAHNEIP